MITLKIEKLEIPSIIIYLGAFIKIITIATDKSLVFKNIQPTSTIPMLDDNSTNKPQGSLEYITVPIETWDYHVDFLVLKNRKEDVGYPIILGRPWLATIIALIDYILGSVKILNAINQK